MIRTVQKNPQQQERKQVIMKSDTKTRVFRSGNSTASVVIFPYGNGWRVKYEHTTDDPGNTMLIASHDEEYEDYDEAEGAYREIVSILQGNGEMKESDGSAYMEARRQREQVQAVERAQG